MPTGTDENLEERYKELYARFIEQRKQIEILTEQKTVLDKMLGKVQAILKIKQRMIYTQNAMLIFFVVIICFLIWPDK